MEEFNNSLRQFAAIWMSNFNGNEAESTESLNKLNELLLSNPDVLPFLSKPKNQIVIGDMVEMLKGSKTKNPITIFNKLSKAAKNLELN